MATTTPNRGYQLPAVENKLKDDVLRLIAALGAIDADVATVLLAMGDKSDVGHAHGIDAITGLVAALNSKIDTGTHDALENLTDVDVAGVANGMALLRQASKWIPVALQVNNIAGLESALGSKASVADINAAINSLVGAAPGALDTLKELSDAIGSDPNFSSTIATALGNRLRVDAAQTLTDPQKALGRANLGVLPLTDAINAAAEAALEDSDVMIGRKADGSLAKNLRLNFWTNYLKGKADAVYQPLKTILTTLGNLANGSGYLSNNGAGVLSWTTPAAGQPIPTSSTFPVGTLAFCLYTSTVALANGSSTAGSNVELVVGSGGAQIIGTGGLKQSGTWMNVSNVTLDGDGSNRSGHMVRTA